MHESDARPFVAEPRCAACGNSASRIELVPPGGRPANWDQLPAEHQRILADKIGRHRDNGQWLLLFSGIEAGNGLGDLVSPERAERIRAAFAEPYTWSRVTTAGLHDDAGFCQPCDAAYCGTHWRPSSTGYGTCPRGHGKSLDPFWYPSGDD